MDWLRSKASQLVNDSDSEEENTSLPVRAPLEGGASLLTDEQFQAFQDQLLAVKTKNYELEDGPSRSSSLFVDSFFYRLLQLLQPL